MAERRPRLWQEPVVPRQGPLEPHRVALEAPPQRGRGVPAEGLVAMTKGDRLGDVERATDGLSNGKRQPQALALNHCLKGNPTRRQGFTIGNQLQSGIDQAI